MIKKGINFTKRANAVYILRILRPGNVAVTRPISGRLLDILVEQPFHINKKFKNGVHAGYFTGKLKEELIGPVREELIKEGQTVLWNEIVQLVDVIRSLTRTVNSKAYFQIHKLGVVEREPGERILTVTPLDGDLTLTKVIRLSEREFDIFINTIKYSSYLTNGTGVTISPEKPLLFKRMVLSGVKYVEDADWDNVNIEGGIKSKLKVLEHFSAVGVRAHATLYSGE
jgi:hypothetical protein